MHINMCTTIYTKIQSRLSTNPHTHHVYIYNTNAIDTYDTYTCIHITNTHEKPNPSLISDGLVTTVTPDNIIVS